MKRAPFLFAVVALCAVVVLAGCSKGTKSSGLAGGSQHVTTIMVAQQVNPDVVGSFKVGDQLRHKDSGAVIGTIESVTTSPTVQAVPTAGGDLKASASPVIVDVRMKIAGDANVTDKGVSFSGTYLYANEIDRFLTKNVQFDGLVVSITPGGSQ